MKKIALIALVSIINYQFSISHAQQTYTQQVPDHVEEIRLEGTVRLMVKSTDGSTVLQSPSQYQVAKIKNNRMTISENHADVTLLLPAGRSMWVASASATG